MSRRRRRTRDNYSNDYSSDRGTGHRSGYRSQSRRYKSRRRAGWGMNLYRNTRDGKIGGVCAGLADHWEVDHWVVRIAVVILFLFMGPLAFWAYVAGWIILAPRRLSREHGSAGKRYQQRDYAGNEPEADDVEVEMEYDENHHTYRPRKMFRYGESPGIRLQRTRERMEAALRRVEDMESYVTSRQYNLNKEFSKL